MAADAAGAWGSPATEQAPVEQLVRDIVGHNISLDYDACGNYDIDSPSCERVKENWRDILMKNPELIHKIAEIYAEFHSTNEELREVLKAQVVLLLATWLMRTGDIAGKRLENKLINYIYDARNTLDYHGVLLDVPHTLEVLEFVIFKGWMSVLHTLQYVVDAGL